MANKLKIVNLTVRGHNSTPGLFEALLELTNLNVVGPSNRFPSRLKIVLEPRNVLLFKSGKYFIMGCASRNEARESNTAFEAFLKEVGLL